MDSTALVGVIVGALGDLFAAVAAVAACWALWFASSTGKDLSSIAERAQKATEGLEAIAARLADATAKLDDLGQRTAQVADTVSANLKLARQINGEELRRTTLERCLRVRSLHYRLRSAQEGYQTAKQISLERVDEWRDRLLTLLDEFRGAVAFLDKDAFPGAWEEANQIGFHSPQGLTGVTGKALADVERVILTFVTVGPDSDSG